MIYDITMLIEEDMQVFANEKTSKPKMQARFDYDHHEIYDTTITLSLHCGTHIDYPLHMIQNGKTSDDFKYQPLIGNVVVVDCTKCESSIQLKDMNNIDYSNVEYIIFKTKNSYTEEFSFDFIYLDQHAANYIASMKHIKAVGIDGLGIERNQEGFPTHKTLLKNDILIIEGLRLKEVTAGIYKLMCFPLKIKGVEATLARVLLEA